MFKLQLIRISLILTTFVVTPTHAQTWQNVRPTMPMADPSRHMDAAQNSMNSAFDSFNNVLKKAEETDRSNWNTMKNNNTQDYLDALHSKKTVKDLLASQYALEQQRTGYGAQIDREVARSAFDDRLSVLTQRERREQSLNNEASRQSPSTTGSTSTCDKSGSPKNIYGNPCLTVLQQEQSLPSTASAKAIAKWTKLGEIPLFTGYVDLSTIQHSGSMSKMWIMYDFKSPEKLNDRTTFLSLRSLEEFDCLDKRRRQLDHIVNAERMAGGSVIRTDSTVPKWSSVAPGSVDDTNFKMACGIK